MIEVYEGSRQIIYGLTSSQIKQIKEDLTFDNPVYKSAKAFGRYSVVSSNIAPHIHFYSKLGDGLVVPRGYKIPFAHKVIKSTRQSHKVLYPKFKFSLRDSQKEAYKAFLDSKDNSGLLVLGTGIGKTILGCYMASKLRERTLVIVQKDDLIVGWRKDIQNSLGINSKNVGLIKAKSRTYGKQITLATIQTVSKLSTEDLINVLNSFGMIIVDECHKSVAQSYDFLYHANAKHIIGLTATDVRADGLRGVMELQFGRVLCRIANSDEILPVRVLVKDTNVEYECETEYAYKGILIDASYAYELMESGHDVKRIGIDNNKRESFISHNLEYNNMLVRDIKHYYSQGKSVILFTKYVEHVSILYNLLSKVIPKSKIGKFVGGINNEEFIRRANSMEICVTLATFKKATEGTNVPVWEVGLLASSLKQPKDVLQAVGRLRRKHGDKKEALVIDYRHPKVTGYMTHEANRDKAYRSIDAKIVKESRGLTKGFR